MTKRQSESHKQMEKRAQVIASRNVGSKAQGTSTTTFWTEGRKNEIRTAYSNGKRVVIVGEKKFKMQRSEANPSYFNAVPADGSLVPMACLERR